MPSTVEMHSLAEGTRLRAKILRAALPIQRVGFAVLGDVAMPLVELDATGRPDLLDLARVHRTEGDGDTHVTVDAIMSPPDGITVILKLELRRPVTCRFSIAFVVAAYREWLATVARSGLLSTVFVAGGEESADTEGVVWTMETEELSQVLMIDALTEMLRPSKVGAA